MGLTQVGVMELRIKGCHGNIKLEADAKFREHGCDLTVVVAEGAHAMRWLWDLIHMEVALGPRSECTGRVCPRQPQAIGTGLCCDNAVE